ncbi:MAG: hypothetical protein SGPRY_011017 [Prymnesium sp.]
MKWLHFLCPHAAVGAAEILDHRSVTRHLSSSSRREFFTIGARSKTSHCILPGFCTCASYCFQVAAKPDCLLCKHELAVLLACALRSVHTLELEEEEWATQFSLAIGIPMAAYAAT